jgi:hypothetical protein
MRGAYRKAVYPGREDDVVSAVLVTDFLERGRVLWSQVLLTVNIRIVVFA